MFAYDLEVHLNLPLTLKGIMYSTDSSNFINILSLSVDIQSLHDKGEAYRGIDVFVIHFFDCMQNFEFIR